MKLKSKRMIQIEDGTVFFEDDIVECIHKYKQHNTIGRIIEIKPPYKSIKLDCSVRFMSQERTVHLDEFDSITHYQEPIE